MFKNREQFRKQARKAVALTLALFLLLPLFTALFPAPVYAEDGLRAPTAELSVWKDGDGKPVATENEVVWQWLLASDDAMPPSTWYITLSKGVNLKHMEADGTWDRAAEIRNAEAMSSDQNRTEPEQVVEKPSSELEPTSANTNSTSFVERLWRLTDAEIEELLGEDGAAQAEASGLTYFGVQTKETTEPQALRLATVADGEEASAQMAVSTLPLAALPATEEIGREDTPATAWVRFARAEEPAEEADTEPEATEAEATESAEAEEPDTEEDGVEKPAEIAEPEDTEEAKTEEAETEIDLSGPTTDDTMDPESESKEYVEDSGVVPNTGKDRNEDSSLLDPADDDIEGSTENTRKNLESFLDFSFQRSAEAFGTSAQMAPTAIVIGPQAEGSGRLGLLGLRGDYSWSAQASYDSETGQTYIDWVFTVFSNRLNSSAYVDFTLPTSLEIDETTIRVTNGSWRKVESGNLYYAFSPRQNYPVMTTTFRTTITDWSSERFEIRFRPASRNSNVEWPILIIDWHQKEGQAYFPTLGLEFDEPAPGNLSADFAPLTIRRDLQIKTVNQSNQSIPQPVEYIIKLGDQEVERVRTGDQGEINLPTGLVIGNTYTIEQISPPAGHGPPVTNPQEITLLFGVNEVVFVNRTLGDIRVNLKETGTAQNLAGGEFELWTTGSDPRKLDGPVSTDANGNAVFPDIEHGLEYEIRQIKAPNGMAPIPQPIVVSHEGTVGSVTDVPVTNEPLRIEVTLQNPKGDPIADSTFVLKDASGNVVGESLITDANGKLTFMGEYLIYDDSYSVEQTGVPEGYVTDEPQSVRLEQATTELLFISLWKANLSVRLTDPDSRPLLGGVFVLKKDGTGEELEQSTDADGKAVWENLGAGTYSLKQKRAPEKHIPDPNTYKVIVDEFGWLKVTLGMDVIFADPLPIVNQPMTQFPATGGLGREVFMIAGFLLMAGTGTALCKMRTKPH